jgi:hypothetical protein
VFNNRASILLLVAGCPLAAAAPDAPATTITPFHHRANQNGPPRIQPGVPYPGRRICRMTRRLSA